MGGLLAYVARRAVVAVPALLVVSFVVFGLQLLLPGDPALALAGEDRGLEVIAYMRREPIWMQYGEWIFRVVRGRPRLNRSASRNRWAGWSAPSCG